MRARQQRVLFLVWLSSFVSLVAALRSPASLFRACVLLGSVILVATSALPLLLARRGRLIDAPRRTAPLTSSAAIMALGRDASAWRVIVSHAAAAAAAALVYAATATQAFGWSHSLAPMIWVPVHRAYYVNEALIVCALAAGGAGAAYGAVFQAWPSLAWHGVPQFDVNVLLGGHSTLRTRFAQNVSRALPHAIGVGLAGALAPLLLYITVRDSFWSFVLRIVGVQNVVRRFTVPSFRLPFAPVTIAMSSVPVVFLVMVVFAIANTLFDVYWTHPLPPLALRARDPNVTLLGGLSDEHPFFACHAFGELARLARFDKGRRQLLFDDVQRQHGRPAAWTGVRVACIKAIDSLLRPAPAPEKRQGGETATASKPALAPAPAPAPTVWQQLLATDAPAPPREKNTSPPAVSTPPPQADTHLFRIARVVRWLAWHTMAAVWSRVPSDAKHVLVPTAFIQSLTAQAPYLCVNAALREHATQAACAADALQHLILASVAEDVYGTVQRDVPVVVQVLSNASARVDSLRHKSEVDALEHDNQLLSDVRGTLAQAGGSAASFSTAHAPYYNELQNAWLSYEPLVHALRVSLREIVDRFAPYGIA